MTSSDYVRPISVGVADKQHAALAYAAEEARLSECDLRVVHAYIVPPRPPQVVNSAYGFDIDGSFRESGREVLAEAARFLSEQYGDLVVHLVLERGSAATVLTDTSRTSRLVVLGPDDEKPWHSRLFLGRISRKLVEAAHGPVVVVPDAWTVRDPAAGVTLLLDGQTVGHGPLRYAFEHAARHDDVLRIVHVEEVDSSHDDTFPWHDMERLIESWQASYPRVEVQISAFAGEADLATIASYERTGLLVMGQPHTHRVIATLPRSLAQAVIEHAPCPVAVVPAHYDGGSPEGGYPVGAHTEVLA